MNQRVKERLGSRIRVAVVCACIGATFAFAVAGLNPRVGAAGSGTGQTGQERGHVPTYGDLPLAFEANVGQTDGQVEFLARTRDYNLFLTSDKAVLSLSGDGSDNERTALYTKLVGGIPQTKGTGAAPLSGTVNYLNSADPTRRYANIPTFGRVAYQAVYPGIDVAYYGTGSQLEYDFTVAPGADPHAIRLGIEGANSIRLDEGGDLIISAGLGAITQQAPRLYQEVDGARRSVAGGFVLTGNEVGFAVGPYDSSRPLVIDPTLAYASYLGGVGNDQADKVRVDSSGSAYVVGTSESIDFPTTPGVIRRSPDQDFATSFVTKLSPDGSSLVYSTFVASGQTGGTNLALAPDGSVWMTGTSDGPADVPVTPGAFLTVRPGGQAAYVVRISPDGSESLYGTYIASPTSSGTTMAGPVAVATNGDVWTAPSLANFMPNSGFPTSPGAIQSDCTTFSFDPADCTADLLLVRIHPVGGGLADLPYATFLGGSGDDRATSVALDPAGLVYLFGTTDSTDLPTTPGALMPTAPGGGYNRDMFLGKIQPVSNGLSAVLYLTYFGGSDQDGVLGGAMALGPDGSAYLTFPTQSFDIQTTPGALQPFKADVVDILVARVQPGGHGPSDLLYSTYLGGPFIDRSRDIAVDGQGHVFLTGGAGAAFPLRQPLACCSANTGSGPTVNQTDGIVVEINPVGQGDADLVFSTFLGGHGFRNSPKGIALAMDINGRARAAYVVGSTDAEDFPVTSGAFQQTYGGGQNDGFVSKIDLTDLIPCTRTLTGNVSGLVVVNPGEVVCLHNAYVAGGVLVTAGGEVRIEDSRIGSFVTSAAAAAFRMCGTQVAGNVAVSGTSPQFITTSGPGCATNTITGTSNVPSGGTPSPTTTTVAPTTTTVAPTTTTTQPTTTTTPAPTTTVRPTTTTAPPSACASLLSQRQAYNAAIDAAEVGQSPAVVAGLEQQRALRNASFDQQLATC